MTTTTSLLGIPVNNVIRLYSRRASFLCFLYSSFPPKRFTLASISISHFLGGFSFPSARLALLRKGVRLWD